MVENNIKKLRQKCGMSQRELAEMAQTTQQSIQRIEAGIQEARFDLAARICKALDEPLGKVFPSTELPLRRAQKKAKSNDRVLDDQAISDLEKAGLDLDAALRSIEYRLTGGAEGVVWLTGPENSRFWFAVQEQEHDSFFVFDAGANRYAINLNHLVFCKFCFDAPDTVLSEDEDQEYKVRVWLSDKPEPLIFGVDPDHEVFNIDEDFGDATQFQDLFFDVASHIEGRFKIMDDDGETAWFLARDVAMFSVPLNCCDPKYWEQNLDEENNEK